MLDDLIADGKELLKKVKLHYSVSPESLPLEQQVVVSELEGWYRGVSLFLERNFGKDSVELQTWQHRQKKTQERSWKDLGSRKPEGGSFVIKLLSSAIGTLTEIKISRIGMHEKQTESMSTRRTPNTSFFYDVCFSFAGEDRDYVEGVAVDLKQAGIKVFYDRYEQVELWGKDLYQHLDTIYRKKAKYCVVYISRAYVSKLWTKHELKSAQARALREDREYILPVRLDDTEVPGILLTAGYIDGRNYSPEELARLIRCKVGTGIDGSNVVPKEQSITSVAGNVTYRPVNSEHREILLCVWHSLTALEEAGKDLWEEVSAKRLSVFADKFREARASVLSNGIFFSEHDFRDLQDILNAADFYLNGKTNLSDIFEGRVSTEVFDLNEPQQGNRFMNPEVRHQIQQNKRWLTRYRNLLSDIRSRFYTSLSRGN
jgi:hypothetical protein